MRAVLAAFALGIFVLQQRPALPGAIEWVAGVPAFAVFASVAARAFREAPSRSVRRRGGWRALANGKGVTSS